MFSISKLVKKLFNPSKDASYTWNVDNVLDEDHTFKDLGGLPKPFACLLLNSPVPKPDFFLRLWRKAELRVAVDGGINRCYPIISKRDDFQDLLPHIVSGDFDSADRKILFEFQELGIEIVPTPSQDETDFTKAMIVLKNRKILNVQDVVVFCEHYGRLDHIMGNIGTLFKVSSWSKKFNIFLVSSDSITWLLNSGQHTIHVPRRIWSAKLSCGIIPVGQKTIVSTTGLRWNLNNTVLEFGGLISSSNHYDTTTGRNVVTITTQHPVLWTMTIVDAT